MMRLDRKSYFYNRPFQNGTIGNPKLKMFGIPICSVLKCLLFKLPLYLSDKFAKILPLKFNSFATCSGWTQSRIFFLLSTARKLFDHVEEVFSGKPTSLIADVPFRKITTSRVEKVFGFDSWNNRPGKSFSKLFFICICCSKTLVNSPQDQDTCIRYSDHNLNTLGIWIPDMSNCWMVRYSDHHLNNGLNYFSIILMVVWIRDHNLNYQSEKIQSNLIS